MEAEGLKPGQAMWVVLDELGKGISLSTLIFPISIIPNMFHDLTSFINLQFQALQLTVPLNQKLPLCPPPPKLCRFYKTTWCRIAEDGALRTLKCSELLSPLVMLAD